jgi:hypothetical protein
MRSLSTLAMVSGLFASHSTATIALGNNPWQNRKAHNPSKWSNNV